MALKNSQYYAIMREYEQKQLKSHDIQTARYEEVYEKLPEFKSLDESISILSVQYGKKLLNGEERALDSLKEELEILRGSKRNLLISAGFPEDYLEPVYECPDCKDTGYIGNEKCHCFKQAIIRLLYEQSNIKEFPTEASFSNFSLDFYSPSHYDKTTGRSARAMMEDTLRICYRFIDDFGKEFQNLFFYGDVGVGKTFLSTCMSLLNRAGGALLGAVQGLLFVWIVFLVLMLFFDTAWSRTAVRLIQENEITGFLYNNNMLMRFITGFFRV